MIHKTELGKRILKSVISHDESLLLVLFDNSQEFIILKIKETRLDIWYHFDLGFIITDAQFNKNKNSILFSGLNSEIIEWDYNNQTVLNRVGSVVPNSLDSSLSGYSCVGIFEKRNLIIAANIGTNRLDFFSLDKLEAKKDINALCEIFARQICIHPGGDVFALLVTDTEDSGVIKLYDWSSDVPRLYTKYINTLFAPGSFQFNAVGNFIYITGGYPPFSYQVTEYPSLDLIHEYEDDNGADMPEPWGNVHGISLNCDIILGKNDLMYVPYFDGSIKQIEGSSGRITASFPCNTSTSVSLVNVESKSRIICSSVSGEVSLVDKLVVSEKDAGSIVLQLPLEDTVTNLMTPLADMDAVVSDFDEATAITY
ncbi:MAG TPA: hypothetical protein VM802_21935 [Chitinophaga sp.]|uniref:hypothetical protein n=1 Tax=Chitinophaga sp. TaxID=1869181 RepID=UPI002BE20183|nr:hypothetical protein [Chitinophaga sp.]HVI47546.1 hypothetical protein [Chitinophaga sp.]